MTGAETYPIRRRAAAARILEGRDDLLVIAGLGSPAWDITAAGDSALNFPMWGAMGGAVSLGLGLAIAQPRRRVLVLTGDGEMLMGLGSLATVAVQRPSNLAICVFDNERYGETGMQETHTASGADLAAIAAGCGIPVTGRVTTPEELDGARKTLHETPGPVFQLIKVRAEVLEFALPPKDGAYLKDRFRQALLGRND